jgi:hypothetical protein
MQLAHVWRSINGQIATEKNFVFRFFFEKHVQLSRSAKLTPRWLDWAHLGLSDGYI